MKLIVTLVSERYFCIQEILLYLRDTLVSCTFTVIRGMQPSSWLSLLTTYFYHVSRVSDSRIALHFSVSIQVFLSLFSCHFICIAAHINFALAPTYLHMLLYMYLTTYLYSVWYISLSVSLPLCILESFHFYFNLCIYVSFYLCFHST